MRKGQNMTWNIYMDRVSPNYVIQGGETDYLSWYRWIKHPMWLHYNQLEYLLQNWYAINI